MEKQRKIKINELRIAFGLAGIIVDEQTTDLIISVHNKVKELGCDFSLMDAVKLQVANERKYKKLNITPKE